MNEFVASVKGGKTPGYALIVGNRETLTAGIGVRSVKHWNARHANNEERGTKMLSDQTIQRETAQVVREMNVIRQSVFGWSINRWADEAGLSWPTIDRLLGKATKYPQYRTLRRMAEPLGYEAKIELIAKRAKRKAA